MSKSIARPRLSSQIKHYLNRIPSGFQDRKYNSNMLDDGCMDTMVNISKALLFYLKHNKEDQVQEYLPVNGHTEQVDIWAARKPVPFGE